MKAKHDQHIRDGPNVLIRLIYSFKAIVWKVYVAFGLLSLERSNIDILTGTGT